MRRNPGEGALPRECEGAFERPQRHSNRDLVKAGVLVGVLVSALALVKISPLGHYLAPGNIAALEARLLAFQGWAPFVYLAGGGTVIAVGVPRSLVSLTGGMVFGPAWGTCLALAAALLGSFPVFFLTRWLGRPLFGRKVDTYLKIINPQDARNGLYLVFLLRQLPLACLEVNVLIGLTSVSIPVFLIGSVAGLLPEALIFALFGGSLQHAFLWRVTLASVCLLGLVFFMRRVYKHSDLARQISLRVGRGKDKTQTANREG